MFKGSHWPNPVDDHNNGSIVVTNWDYTFKENLNHFIAILSLIVFAISAAPSQRRPYHGHPGARRGLVGGNPQRTDGVVSQ